MSSPSFLHEGLIALVRDRPAFAAELLREVLHVNVPKFTEARMGEATLSELVPVELRADAVVLLEDGEPVCGIVGEAQLSPDPDKRYTWPAYSIVGRARHRCPFFVVVITPDAATARWASQPIDLEDGNVWSPSVIGPDGIPLVSDRERAGREPQLSVLSCIAHGRGDVKTAVSIAVPAIQAMRELPEAQRLLYYALIESALSDAARKALEMIPDVQNFFSESQRRSFDLGQAKAVIAVLEERGIPFSSEQRQRILDCTDVDTLDRWIRRAVTIATVDELFS